MLRMSTMFLRTLREDPADAEVASHRLLVRAGYIRRAAPGGFTWLPTRVDRVPQRRARRPRRDGSCRVPRGPLPGAGAPGAVRAVRPLDRLRRQRVPPEGSPRRRHAVGADARGTVHAARQGPVQQLQGPAAGDLPDPDQVPRRSPPAGRPAARPRVRDEGLVQLRPHRRGPGGQLPTPPRRVPAHVRPPRPAVRDRLGDERRDGRLRQRRVPGPDGGRRRLLRALHELRLRGQHRGSPRRRAGTGGVRRGSRGDGRRHTRHADHRDARRSDQRSRRSPPPPTGHGPRPTR